MRISIASVYVLVFLTVACSTKQEIKLTEPDQNPKTVMVNFTRPLGVATLEFDEDGHFVQLTGKASAAMTGNNVEGVEQAVTVATMRAKRHISEFIESDLSSERTLNVLSDGALKRKQSDTNNTVTISDNSYDVNGEISSNRSEANDTDLRESQRISENVREFITLSSSNILRGLRVINETVDNDQMTVVVEVAVTRDAIKAAKNLKELMK